MYTIGDVYQHEFHTTEHVYDGFITLFNDRNVLHTDSSFAIKKGFTGKVMHGNILNGYLSFFIGECLPEKHVIIHSQTINFVGPVYMNDKLSFSAKVIGFYESVNAIEFSFLFKNSETKTVAKGKIQIGILK